MSKITFRYHFINLVDLYCIIQIFHYQLLKDTFYRFSLIYAGGKGYLRIFYTKVIIKYKVKRRIWYPTVPLYLEYFFLLVFESNDIKKTLTIRQNTQSFDCALFLDSRYIDRTLNLLQS
jgi:hypothetical protein